MRIDPLLLDEGLTKKMYRSIDRSFEEYLEKKSAGQVEAVGCRVETLRVCCPHDAQLTGSKRDRRAWHTAQLQTERRCMQFVRSGDVPDKGQSPRIEVPPEPKDVVPPRPRRKESDCCPATRLLESF